MAISGARASYGLSAVGALSRTKVSGTAIIGQPREDLTFTDADVAYSLRAIIANASSDFVLYPFSGATTGSTSWTAGTAQVLTVAASGTITASGDAEVSVTDAALSGGGKAIAVAVTNGDTAAVWAAKVRTALAADTDISGLYSISGAGTSIILTLKPSAIISGVSIHKANSLSRQITLDNSTSSGITFAGSTTTTSGVATSGVLIYDDGKDFQGDSLAAMSDIQGFLIQNSNGEDIVEATGGNGDFFSLRNGETSLFAGDLGIEANTQYTFNSASTSAEVTITVIGYQ